MTIDAAFLSKFKQDTESLWAQSEINPRTYGFQIQPGTRWNPGLSANEIDRYQAQVGVVFPNDFRLMLEHLNGTDLPSLNFYGSCGDPLQKAFETYAYPRDLSIVSQTIESVQKDREEIADVLLEDEQYELDPQATLFPIFGHRFVVCSTDLTHSRVLSIVGTDVITYGLCLQSYLTAEFLAT